MRARKGCEAVWLSRELVAALRRLAKRESLPVEILVSLLVSEAVAQRIAREARR